MTVIGENVFATEIHSQKYDDSLIDWRKGEEVLNHYKHNLPIAISKMCIEITRQLKLDYSAIDLIYTTNSEYVFLEINPNGQWAWIETRIGFPISEKIVDLLEEGYGGINE